MLLKEWDKTTYLLIARISPEIEFSNCVGTFMMKYHQKFEKKRGTSGKVG